MGNQENRFKRDRRWTRNNPLAQMFFEKVFSGPVGNVDPLMQDNPGIMIAKTIHELIKRVKAGQDLEIFSDRFSANSLVGIDNAIPFGGICVDERELLRHTKNNREPVTTLGARDMIITRMMEGRDPNFDYKQGIWPDVESEDYKTWDRRFVYKTMAFKQFIVCILRIKLNDISVFKTQILFSL